MADQVSASQAMPFHNLSGATSVEQLHRSPWPTVAGVFAWIALFIAIYEIVQHMTHYNKPYLQKYVIRILWMVPIYAMNSWLAMEHESAPLYLDTLRECYEAFVIYSFMKYLTNFLYREMDVETILDMKPQVKHPFPMDFLPPLTGGRTFHYRCKHLILQYAVLRPITTLITLITELCGVYGEGNYDFSHPFFYILIVNNVSQMLAMYFLALFYNAYKEELAPMNPLLKFLCIKAVIFMSFFQQVVISLLVDIGFLTEVFGIQFESKNVLSRNIQDFLICFEMFLAAIAHLFAFSYKPFIDRSAGQGAPFHSFMSVMDFSDERRDVDDHFRQIWCTLKNVFTGKQRSDPIFSSNCEVLIPLKARTSRDSNVVDYRSNESTAEIA